MKKHLYASLLAACLTVPAVAAPLKLSAKSPDDPVRRSAVVLCIAVFVGLHTYQRRVVRAKRVMSDLR